MNDVESQPHPSSDTVSQDEFIITDLETLKAISDPLRARIMEALARAPRTVKDIAAELDAPPTRLYHHVKLLEKHGIVRVAETRIVSGIIEKRYRLVARQFRVDRSLLSPGFTDADASLEYLLANTVDAVRQDIEAGVRSRTIDMDRAAPEPGALTLARSLSRLTPEQARTFHTRLRALYDEFNAGEADPLDEDVQLYGFLVAFYPAQRPPPPNPSEETTHE